MSEKQTKFTQAGRTLIVVLDGEKLPPFTSPDKEKREEIKKMVEAYIKLPSKSKAANLRKLFMPKTEAKLLAQKTEKKVQKNKVKELEAQLASEKEKNKNLEETLATLGKANNTLAETTDTLAGTTEKQAEVLEKVIPKAEAVPQQTSQTGRNWGGEYGGRR